MSTYHLIDEPRPGPIAHLTVDPMWPLLGYMLGSPFFSWIWYAFNSYVLGSPTKRKEIPLILTGVIGVFGWIIAAGYFKSNGTINDQTLPYLRLMLTIFTLTISYMLYVIQNRTFEIYEYFGGKVMSGIPGLLVAIFLGQKLQRLVVTSVLGALN